MEWLLACQHALHCHSDPLYLRFISRTFEPGRSEFVWRDKQGTYVIARFDGLNPTLGKGRAGGPRPVGGADRKLSGTCGRAQQYQAEDKLVPRDFLL